MDIATKHQNKIAWDTLKLSQSGALILGGMNHKEAINHLLNAGYGIIQVINKLRANGFNNDEIQELIKE